MVQAKVTIEEPTLTSEIEEIPIKLVATKGDKGDNGEDGFSPTVETSKSGKTTTITITDVNGEHTATILDGADGSGTGDMSKAIYDTNNSGVVDDAEKVNSHTVEDDVPSGFFTGAATGSFEGTIVDLSDAISLNSIELNGDTDQDGTPTPDAPVNIQVVTGTQVTTVTGKNICSECKTENANKLLYFRLPHLSSGEIVLSATLSVSLTGNTYGLELDGVFTQLGTWSTQLGNRLIKVLSLTDAQVQSINNSTNAWIRTYKSAGGFAIPSDAMIEYGTDASTYEPYISHPYTVNLGSTELCKIGDYQDYIYKSGDDWYVHKEISKYTFTSSDNWNSSSYGTNSWTLASKTDDYSFVTDKIITACDFATPVSYNGRATGDSTQTTICYLTNNGVINIRNTNITTKADMQAATNDKNLYYVVTPTDTKITDNTLIGQLEALAAAKLYTGGSMSSSGNLPAILTVEALVNTRSGMIEAINAAGTTYTAGTGISITNGVISCTFADGDTEEY